eukprot:3829299-Amphidinium_carterae.1
MRVLSLTVLLHADCSERVSFSYYNQEHKRANTLRPNNNMCSITHTAWKGRENVGIGKRWNHSPGPKT